MEIWCLVQDIREKKVVGRLYLPLRSHHLLLKCEERQRLSL